MSPKIPSLPVCLCRLVILRQRLRFVLTAFGAICMYVWYGMVNVDLYSAIITKVSNALNTLVSREMPCFQALSKGCMYMYVCVCACVCVCVCERRPNVCSYRDVELSAERRPCNKTYTRMVRVWKPNCRGPATQCLGFQRRSDVVASSPQLFTRATIRQRGQGIARNCLLYTSPSPRD